MRSTRNRVLLVVLCFFLGLASESFAGETRRRGPQFGSASFIQMVGNFFTSLWEKIGCEIDPWGRCIVSPSEDHQGSTPQGGIQEKTGCRIDPFGVCVADPGGQGGSDSNESPIPKAGCKIDPLGACAP
jgi:hypothetical protein